jgi:hypothetical protein
MSGHHTNVDFIDLEKGTTSKLHNELILDDAQAC